MVAADLTRAVLIFLLPFLVSFNMAWLYIIVTLQSVIAQFFNPAHASVIPEVASDEELAAANSLLAISAFGSTAVGFAASGFLSTISIEWAFYIDSLTFIVSALCIAAVRIAPLVVEGKTNVTTVFRNMKNGFDFLWHSPVLRSSLIIASLTFAGSGLWNTLLLPFARQALHATEFEFGLQEGLTSVGFVFGSLAMARVSNRLREGQWLAVSFLAMGIIKLIYAQMDSVWLAVMLVIISGFVNAPSGIARNLLIQRNAPRQVRGRVNSVFAVIRSVAFLIGMVIAGLADVYGVRAITFFSGIITIVPGLLALVLPGIGQPGEDWRRAMELLRTALPQAKPGASRPATLADFDALVIKLPALAGLADKDRRNLIDHSRVLEFAPATPIVERGETSDEVYFILAGSAVAGIASRGNNYQSLETMRAGDFFGEIAALATSTRTANVVAEESTRVLQVPSETFRQLMQNSALNAMVKAKFLERVTRTSLGDLPRFAELDQQDLRELRKAPAK